MKKLFSFLCLLLLLSSVVAQKSKEKPDQRLAGLDAKLQAILPEWKTAGFAVAVVEKNRIIYAKGFGYRDYEGKVPVTPNTLFAIGSCTKAFTSSLLGLLVNENKLDLGKSPEFYLIGLKFFNKDMDNLITVRDLMCHRTGLPRHDYSWYFFPTDSKDSLMIRIQYQEPSAGIREKYQYNNFMFMLQGLIAEKITGQIWGNRIREKFFNPLGMSSSNLSIKELEKSSDAAKGYRLKNDTIIEKVDYYHIRGMSPAGSINSSVNEMARWVITWINGGKFEGKTILPPAYVTEAISSQMVASGGLPSKENPDMFFSGYGYGWGLSSYRGHYRVQHSGGIDGFTAMTCFFPTDSIGIIVLANEDGSTVPSLVRNIIADKMLNLTSIDWNKNLKAERDKNLKSQKEAEAKTISNKKKGTAPSHKLSEYTGRFFNPGYGTIRITESRDSLFAVFPITKFWLKHYHYDIFQPYYVTRKGIDTAENNELRFNFRTNDSGEIERISIVMEPSVKAVDFKRQTEAVTLSGEKLRSYAGEYLIGDFVSRFYIKNDQTLFLVAPGQPNGTFKAAKK